MTSRPAAVNPAATRAAVTFGAAGIALMVIGVLTWATPSWALRIGGIAAIALGGYVFLVGIGLWQVWREQRRQAVERQVDAAIAEIDSCTGDGAPSTCATCDTVCSLRH